MNFKLVLLGLTALSATSFIIYTLHQQPTDFVSEAEVLTQFLTFKSNFGKNYASLNELSYRRNVFADTLKRIKAHNADSSQTYQLGITQFSDMTAEERKAKYLVEMSQVNGKNKCEKSAPSIAATNDDQVVDWVKANKVQPVKDQGDCNACWAFSAVGALESAYAIFKQVEVPEISVQELIDCSDDYGNAGCLVGLMGNVFDYIMDHKINTEKTYPYLANNQV